MARFLNIDVDSTHRSGALAAWRLLILVFHCITKPMNSCSSKKGSHSRAAWAFSSSSTLKNERLTLNVEFSRHIEHKVGVQLPDLASGEMTELIAVSALRL